MNSLKNNIDHYMKLKGIKMYSHLLIKIANELGIKGQEAYEFANKEKSNFSKMLKEERPLKYEFIIPLEKIFGVSLARLLDEDAYKLPIEKDNVPFSKGFEYYAYLDDPKLYKKELDLLTTRSGHSIISRIDEFENSFLDYVVEYNSINAVRYLHDEYGIKIKWYHNHFQSKKTNDLIFINFKNLIEFARLVASMNDAQLFYDIFDSYNMFLTNGHYGSEECIFCQDEFLEIILDNDDLFHSMFQIKPYEYKLGNIEKRKCQVDSITYNLINPIINNCLRYTLNHLDKYKNQAIEILKFGIDYNSQKLSEIVFDECYICNELGGLKNYRNNDYYDIVIFVDTKVNDKEIAALINKLPKFNSLNL